MVGRSGDRFSAASAGELSPQPATGLSPGNRPVRSVGKVAIGLVVGQTAIIGTTPLITRLYTDSQIGSAAIFLALASIIGGISTLRLESQLARSTDRQTPWLVKTSALSVGLISLAGAPVYAVASPTAGPAEALIFGITVAGLGGVLLFTQWSARQSNANGLAISKGVQGCAQSSTQVAGAIAGSSGIGLQLGFAVGYVASATAQFCSLARNRSARLGPSVSPVAQHDRRHLWRTGLILTVATLVNSVTVWFLPLLLGSTFGLDATGQFSVAQRFAVAPAGLVVAAITPIIATTVGRSIRQGSSIATEIRFWSLKLLLGGIFAGLILLVVPTSFVTGALGPDWEPVVGYLRALSPLIALQVAVGPFSQLLAIVGRSGLQLSWDLMRLAGVVATALITAAAWNDPQATVLACSIVFAVFYAAYFLLLRWHGDALVLTQSGGK